MRNVLLYLALFGTFIAHAQAGDQTAFERARTEMRKQLEKPQADGTVKPNKQLRRWEWYWQGRLTDDGSFPTPAMYAREHQRVEREKPTDAVMAAKAWKDLGPIAPDMPNEISSWNGIGRVNVIEFSRQDPNLMWVGAAAGGVWKTTNGAATWSYVNIDIIPVIGISDIAVSPNNDKIIYVATGDVNGANPGSVIGYDAFSYGVIKTTDGGATWKTTGLSFEASQNAIVGRLFVDPRNASVVVAASYSGILRSTDGGTTFRQSINGSFRDLVANPTNPDVLYASTFNFNGNAKIYRSTDNGVTWEETFSIPRANRIRLAVSKANPNVVGAVASDASTNGLEGVYRSTNAAESFSEVNTSLNLLHWNANGQGSGGQGWYDLSMEISPTNANHMFVGGVNLWRTTTAGQQWILSAHWTGSGAPWVHADHHYAKYHPSLNRLFATHDGGVARSTDGGMTWRDCSNGLKIQQYYGLATSVTNPSLIIGGSQDNGTALSKNNGQSFVHTLDGDGMMAAIDYVDPSIMYGSQYDGQFYRTTNQGANWIFTSNRAQRGENLAAWVSPVAADPKTMGTAYIGYGQLYKTTNSGVSWTRISTIATSVPMRWIAVSPSDPKHIYVSYNSALWYTTNGGTAWTQQTGISGTIMGIEVHPTDPKKFWIAIGGFNGGQKVLQVVNGVVTNASGTGLPNVPCNALVYQRGTPNRLFAATDLGVFYSDEGSGFWQKYGTGLPAVPVSAMRLNATTNSLRISTFGRGMWEVDVKQCSATTPSITRVTATTGCVGDSVVLEANAGYTSYRWSNGDTTRRLVLRAVSQTGSYSVNVEDANGCRAVSAPVAISILTSPTKPTITQRGLDTLRSSAVGGITVFQWQLDGKDIPGATAREYVAKTSGTYAVRVENSNKCRNTSSDFVLTLNPTSVEGELDRIASSLTVFPNPAQERATVVLPASQARSLELIDIMGRVVFRAPIDDERREYAIELGNVVSGTYVVRVSAGSSVWMARLVRE